MTRTAGAGPTRASGTGPTRASGTVPTVLALRALGLGDALTGIPALRGLRRAFPGHRLVLAAPDGLGGWLCRLGVVDAVWPSPGLQELHWPGPAPAVAVNLHGRGPQSHRLLHATHPRRLLAFGCPPAEHAGPDWLNDEHEVARWCRLVHTSTGVACGPEDLRLRPAQRVLAHANPERTGSVQRGPVVVHPGAASQARRWPGSRWVTIARELARGGHRVFLTGSAQERSLCADIAQAAPGSTNTAGQLDLDALTALVARAGLVLCGDTGVAHLATACGTPSVLLFGPTPPHRWGPLIDPQRHAVLWHGDGSARSWGDPHGTVTDPRLAAITTREVLDAAERLLPSPSAVLPHSEATPSGGGHR